MTASSNKLSPKKFYNSLYYSYFYENYLIAGLHDLAYVYDC